jgi:hypothetical protein
MLTLSVAAVGAAGAPPVQRHKHRVDGCHEWLQVALVGGVDGPVPDGVGVASRHSKPVAGEGFVQRGPGGA